MSALSAVILAGGQGSRMGGVDKGLVGFRDQPMITHTVNLVRPFVGELIISCNRNEPEYQQLADITVADPVEGFQGPLMGILAGLQNAAGESLLVLPCDTPLLNAEVLNRLTSVAGENPEAIVVLAEAGRLHPLHAVIPVALVSDLEQWLEGGQRAVQRWMRNHPMVEVDVTDLSEQLSNLNTLEELRLNS